MHDGEEQDVRILRLIGQSTDNFGMQQHMSFVNLLQDESSHKPRDFWKNIKKRFPTKTKCNDLPPMMNFEGMKINDKSTIANTFCMFFSTTGSKLQQQVISLHDRIWKVYTNKRLGTHSNLSKSFHFNPVSPLSVEKLLKSLKTSKATGPDNIPASMLKEACKELVIPLCYLANVSLSTGIFQTPNNWPR